MRIILTPGFHVKLCYTAVPWELVAMRKAGKIFKGMRLFRCMEMGCLVKRKTPDSPKA